MCPCQAVGELGTCSNHETAPATAATIQYGVGSYRLKVVARFPGGIVKKGKRPMVSGKLKILALCKVELEKEGGERLGCSWLLRSCKRYEQ